MKEKFWNDLKAGDVVYYFNSSRDIRTSKVFSIIKTPIPKKQYDITTGIQFDSGRYTLYFKGKEGKPILKANSCTYYVSMSKELLEEKRKKVINSEVKSLENQINKLEDMKNRLLSLL